jgi:hypothetical protein
MYRQSNLGSLRAQNPLYGTYSPRESKDLPIPIPFTLVFYSSVPKLDCVLPIVTVPGMSSGGLKVSLTSVYATIEQVL